VLCKKRPLQGVAGVTFGSGCEAPRDLTSARARLAESGSTERANFRFKGKAVVRAGIATAFDQVVTADRRARLPLTISGEYAEPAAAARVPQRGFRIFRR
jgi:hypothetical protein